ncbi:hypothetical protein OIU34_05900 [Pararhizobium sp. BT-229]|uniref:hypothetical protein n=1 Tax=Pararhizobium sp. BT-229 TaxID=2986923 RepID=UPI0021F7A5C5|nr:hypothetical protein [Pararhizobium sp. BT-229]MCV9961429.1 hypothetical protein [Pararhizobium sp. BT-229]
MFGMSVFQSVLERLKAEEDEGHTVREEQVPSMSIRGFNQGFVGNLSSSGMADSGSVQRAYFDTASEDMLAPPKPLPKPVMPDHLCRIRPDEIAADLGLTDDETLTGLADKRRRFAAQNHPDRHYQDFRSNATVRMKIANMLIDEALRRLQVMQRT